MAWDLNYMVSMYRELVTFDNLDDETMRMLLGTRQLKLKGLGIDWFLTENWHNKLVILF